MTKQIDLGGSLTPVGTSISLQRIGYGVCGESLIFHRNQQFATHSITEVVTAPRSPWQNAYVERVIGSIRRERLDHFVIFNERHLRRVLSAYVDYYQRTRTHLSLNKDCPDPRPITPRRIGKVIAVPQVGGLHYRYERLAA